MIEYGQDNYAPLSMMDARFRENAIAWRLGVAMSLWSRGDSRVAVDIDELIDRAESVLRWASEDSDLFHRIVVEKLDPQ